MTSRLALFIETLGMHPDFHRIPWVPQNKGDEPPF